MNLFARLLSAILVVTLGVVGLCPAARAQMTLAYPSYKVLSIDRAHHRLEATAKDASKAKVSILIDSNTSVIQITSMSSNGYGGGQEVSWRSIRIGTTIYVEGDKVGDKVKARNIYL